MRKNIWFILLTIALLCSACRERVVYTTFHSLPLEGWHQDSALTYTAEITDSTALYDMLIIVRYNGEYPYQNLWLFVDEYQGETCVYQDTIEALLADDYGRWLGTGISRYELPLLYDEQRRFERTGEHRFVIRQGMRSEWLKGIQDIGVVIRE